MAEVERFEAGGYRFIEAVFQYSGGVAAEPGFEIERARLAKPLPVAEGLAAAEAYLGSIGRPPTAFCACELRSPAPFTEPGFIEFNRIYVKTLERWGIFANDVNPVARTNVCPEYDKPPDPSLIAFSYTVPAAAAAPSFILSGGGEGAEKQGRFRDQIVRLGDTSPGGMRDKVRYVLAEMERRLSALGFAWPDASATRAYTVYDIGALVGEEIAKRGAAPAGLTWHYCRPPVEGMDYEMDVHGPARVLRI